MKNERFTIRLAGINIGISCQWNGKHSLGNNISMPVRAVCILTRAEKNSICEISKAEAYAALVGQTYRPADAAALIKTMELIDRLAAAVKLYRLGCNMEPEAARVAYNAMKGEQL